MKLEKSEIIKMVQGRCNHELIKDGRFKLIAVMDKNYLNNYGYDEKTKRMYEEYLLKYLDSLGYIIIESDNFYSLSRESTLSYARYLLLNVLSEALGYTVLFEDEKEVEDLQCFVVTMNIFDNLALEEQNEQVQFNLMKLIDELGFVSVNADNINIYFKRKEER